MAAESTYKLLLQENELANQLGQDPSSARRLINFIPSRAGELFRKPYSPPFSVNPPAGYWFSFVRDFIFYVAGVPTRKVICAVSNNVGTFLYRWAAGGNLVALPTGAYSPPHNAGAGWVGNPLILPSDGLLYISDGYPGSNGTVYDGTDTWKQGLDVPAAPALWQLTSVVGIGGVTFTGVGLDDMKAGGQFTGGPDAAFEVIIDSVGTPETTPDTFKWRIGTGAYTTGVSITGSDQTLARGITVKFAAQTGHTVDDKWNFTCQGLFIDSFVEYALTEYDSTRKRESAPGPRLRVTPPGAGYFKIQLSWPARVNSSTGWTTGEADKFRVYRSQLDGSTQLYRLTEVAATGSGQANALTDFSPFYGDELYTQLPIQPPYRNQKPRPSLVGCKFNNRFALRDEARRSRLWITGFKEILEQQSFMPGLETVPGTTNQALVEGNDEKKLANLSDFENFVELSNEQFEIRAMLWFRDGVMIGTERDVVIMFGRNPEDPFQVANTSTYAFGIFHRNGFCLTTHGLVMFTADRKLVLDPSFGGGGGDRTAQVEDIGWPKQPQLDKTDIQYTNRFEMVHYKFGRDRDWLVVTYTTQNAIDGGLARMLIYDFNVRGWITFDDVEATCVGIVQEDQGYQFLVAGNNGSAGADRALRVVTGYSSDSNSAYAAAAGRMGLPGAGTETRPANLYRSAMLDLGSPEFWKLWERVSYYVKLGTPSVLVKYWGDPRDMDTLTADFMANPSFWSAGAGLNDLTSSGTFTGADGSTFEVEIDGVGPDTFKWRKDDGAYTLGVAITGGAQLLSDGISVTFAATTGHTVGNRWTLGASEVLIGSTLTTNEVRLWINRNKKQHSKRAVIQFSIAAGGADGAIDGLEISVLPKASMAGRL